jgi:hypothetical protein
VHCDSDNRQTNKFNKQTNEQQRRKKKREKEEAEERNNENKSKTKKQLQNEWHKHLCSWWCDSPVGE